MTRPLILAVLALLLASEAAAQAINEFRIERTAQPPKMDGVLDDERR